MRLPKVIVITGPTSSGKTSLSLELAKKFNGEIVSADSRQVYKGMDLGTGKVTEKEQRSIEHYLIDIASPKKQFTVAQYKTLAINAIKKIQKKHKVPFLVGGSPLYINALIYDWQIPEVKPNQKLRQKLEKKSTTELFTLLKKLDPNRAADIDRYNKRRLIRAIEINKAACAPVPKLKKKSIFDLLILGVKKNPGELKTLIAKRLETRLKHGMINEIKRLHRSGISYKKFNELGLEYRFVAKFLRHEITYIDMKNQLLSAIHKFSRRQMTWFRKMPIVWISNQKQAIEKIKIFLNR